MVQFHTVVPLLFKGYALLFPEALLILAAFWALFATHLPGRDRGASIVAAVLVTVAGLITAFTAAGTALFGAKLLATTDTRFGGVALCALALIWLIWTATDGKGRTAEAVALVCLSLTGALLAIQAADLIILLLSLELSAMPIYVLIGYRRRRKRGLEGALKYFLLSMLTSLFLFYGASFAFGLVGTTSYAGLLNLPAEPLAAVVLIFMFVGILAKMSVAPFHFWAPDAYEGAQPWSVAFAATVPKVAASFVLVRLIAMLQGQADLLKWALLIAAVLSMLIGSLGALTQTDVRRMMAYSGVVNMGYVLVALGAAGTVVAGESLYFALFFTVAYALPTMGILLICASEGSKVSDLAGLSKRRPVAAGALAVSALSLVGVPPLMGFFGKFFIFLSGVASKLLPFVIIMVVFSVVSAFYYLRLIKAAFFDAPAGEEPEKPRASLGAELAVLLCALLTFGGGLASGLIMAWIISARY
ncbi:MAG: NADH-quinone oxidoreductase subunit N [Actinomycetia bacterium]|nr:NADH-quinone oxidoreductase subunit N [Actinomycetes bacterium]